jgi:hypothetical protein
MSLATEPRFHHRRNRSFGFDSLCSRCFASVGSENDEEALASHDAVHICDPLRLHQLGKVDIPRFLLMHDRRNPENDTA